jgi:pimeloyl-ACP methyl ester carboxylesterase
MQAVTTNRFPHSFRLLLGLLAILASAVSTNSPAASRCGAACVSTKTVYVAGTAFAYRELGPCRGTPLIMVNRFRGTMDEWDPAFIDALARERRVILFDNAGVARSGGTAATTLAGWADNVAAFARAIGLKQVDVFGFSFGGLVGQELAYRHPALVRRLVIAGSGAGYVEGASLRADALAVATRPVNTDEDFLFLFFRDTPTSQAAGRAHLARLRTRPDAFAARVSEATWKAMLAAGSDVGTPETSLLNRAPTLNKPVLVANGIDDRMIPTVQSFALAQALPNARLILYPDSGHAFMFQHIQAFSTDVLDFLR